jgi:hypothetical protein
MSVGLTEHVIYSTARTRGPEFVTPLGQVLIPKYKKSSPRISLSVLDRVESHSLDTASKLVDSARGAGDGVASDMVQPS